MTIFPLKKLSCGEAYSKRIEAALYCWNKWDFNWSNITPQPLDRFYHDCANLEHQDVCLYTCEFFHFF